MLSKTSASAVALVAALALCPLAVAEAASEIETDWVQVAKNAKHGNGKGPKQQRHSQALQYSYATYSSKGGPPPWAPAHGYRRKQAGGQVYVTPRPEPYYPPFGLDRGFCERDVIGAILGGETGAAIGSELGKGDYREVAILGGTVLGVIVGGTIGRAMDEADQTCVGQALEHAPDGERIAWNGERNQAQYEVTPVATYEDNAGRYCREYQTTATVGGRAEGAYGIACREPDGSWRILQ